MFGSNTSPIKILMADTLYYRIAMDKRILPGEVDALKPILGRSRVVRIKLLSRQFIANYVCFHLVQITPIARFYYIDDYDRELEMVRRFITHKTLTEEQKQYLELVEFILFRKELDHVTGLET